jgi:hypothetical protein
VLRARPSRTLILPAFYAVLLSTVHAPLQFPPSLLTQITKSPSLLFPASTIVTHLELGVDDLDDDLLVGEPNNEPVLGRVVLVLGLGDQSLPGVVVGLSFSSPPGLDLEPGEVGRVLLELDERHF